MIIFPVPAFWKFFKGKFYSCVLPLNTFEQIQLQQH